MSFAQLLHLSNDLQVSRLTSDAADIVVCLACSEGIDGIDLHDLTKVSDGEFDVSRDV